MKFQRCSIPPAILFLAASLLFIVLFSMLAPVLFPIDLGQTNLLNRLLPPSFMPGGQPQFLLGTDHLGRDFAIRLVYATRNTLLISFSGMLIASLIGTTLGVIGGLYRGWADTMVMFLIDARLSVPFIVIAIVCSSIFGSDKVMMVLIIGFAGWASFARLIRGQIIQLREANFIECSRAIGASRLRILFEHILRNISSPLIVHATMRLSSFILLESTLSFLGLGILPPDASLGVMVSAGRDYMISAWWLTMIPSAVIVVIVLQVSVSYTHLTLPTTERV